MIDWLNPSDDVLEARRIGYEERDAEVADEIDRLLAENDAAWDSAEHNAKRARDAEARISEL